MNHKSDKNKNENYNIPDNLKSELEKKLNANSSEKLSNLEEKFHKQLKESEEKLDKEFEAQFAQNLDENYEQKIVKNTESNSAFKNSYTQKIDVASQAREKAIKEGSNKYIKYSSIGMEMLGSVLLGGFGGNWLDKKMELGFPFFTITLILLGLAATFTHLIMQLNADRKAEDEKIKNTKTDLQ